MLNLAVQTSAKTECLGKTKHGKHQQGYFSTYYQKNKEKFLVANQKYHLKKQALKSPKSRSFFVKEREQKALKCLDKHHITVPIPRFLKIKHPIIKGWNQSNWWCQETITDLLNKGWNYFTLLNKDNSYQGVRIGCIDIDEKGWTKIPTKYWTCYISPSNGKIKLLFLYQNNQGLKTSAGYYQGHKILDFKISGGIMGLGSIHPNGKPYQLKGAGSFFLKNNQIFKSPQEVINLLKKDWEIEIKSQKENLITKLPESLLIKPTKSEIPFHSVVDPPQLKMIITLKKPFQNSF